MKSLSIIERALKELCQAYEARDFVPLLESDIAGYLYYLLVKARGGNASQIHLSARIQKKGEQRKYPDLVIGPILSIPEQVASYEKYIEAGNMNVTVSKDNALRAVRSKSFSNQHLKPYIDRPEIAVEIKPFLKGFSYQQLRRRAEKAKEDIEALAHRINAMQKFLLLFDEKRFLRKGPKQNPLEELLRLKNEADRAIRIIYVCASPGGTCSWEFDEQ